MSIDAKLDTLGRKHQELETELHQQMRHPALDEVAIHDIKRRKLAIKDEMNVLRSRGDTR